MEYTNFADHPLKISKICLGTMTFGDSCDYSLTERIVKTAYEKGVNFFDTAAMYVDGVTEEYLGKALKGIDRESFFVGTKVVKGIDAESILTGIDESLLRLQMDYVDLYMIHWPVKGMNLTEMMGALNQVVELGKAKYIGVCNFSCYLMASANSVAAEKGWHRLECNQVAYNLIERGIEVEILPHALLEDIVITAYRPLAVGLLTGKFRQGQKMDARTRGSSDSRVITWLSQYGAGIENFINLAEKKGVHPAQLAISWILHNQAVTSPIVGVSSLTQLNLNLETVDISLTDEEYLAITHCFDTEVKEEGLQIFPGLTYNYPRLRRQLNLATRK